MDHCIRSSATLFKPNYIYAIVLGSIFMYSSVSCGSHNRQVTSKLLCNDTNQDDALVYSDAKGDYDDLHYLFSTTGGPSILVLKSTSNSTLHINCSQFFNGNETKSIAILNGSLQYLYGFALTRLLQYDDTKDAADLNEMSNDNSSWAYFGKMVWNQALDGNTIHWSVTSNYSGLNFLQNGSLNFSFTVHEKTGEASFLPHLDYNSNTTQGLFILNQVQSDFKQSRFALEMALFSNDSTGKDDLFSYKSIDDGHTPGVFQVTDWTVKGRKQKEGSYVQWKPICYTNEDASMKHSTTVNQYNLQYNMTALESLLARAAKGLVKYQNIVWTNVSFGLTDDGFYKSSNYTSWSFTLGYGAPPTDKISTTILLIVGIGLGLPFCLLIIGLIYTCVKKCRPSSSRSGYTSIQ